MSEITTVEARKRTARRAILIFDLVLLLFPPIYWAAGSGDTTLSLWYFIGGNLLVTLSLFVLWALRERDDEEGEI